MMQSGENEKGGTEGRLVKGPWIGKGIRPTTVAQAGDISERMPDSTLLLPCPFPMTLHASS